jgi:hypothetical protein
LFFKSGAHGGADRFGQNTTSYNGTKEFTITEERPTTITHEMRNHVNVKKNQYNNEPRMERG